MIDNETIRDVYGYATALGITSLVVGLYVLIILAAVRSMNKGEFYKSVRRFTKWVVAISFTIFGVCAIIVASSLFYLLKVAPK